MNKELAPHTTPFTSYKREFAGWVSKRLYDIQISAENRVKIADLQQILQGNKDLLLYIYFNHISFPDPAFILHIAHLIDSQSQRRIVLPGSAWHTQWKNNPIFTSFAQIGSFFYDMDVVPVVQTYQLNEPEKYGYNLTDAFSGNRKLLRTIGGLRKSGVPLTFILSPEGHRSDTGALGYIENGIIKTGEYLTPLVYCPIGITYAKKFNRGVNLNLLNKPQVNISIGELTFKRTPHEEVTLDTLMSKLAIILPEHMRGKWD